MTEHEAVTDALGRLRAWCEVRDWRGDDPYDALGADWFLRSPMGRSRWGRMAWTQLHCRLPINLRRPAGIRPGHNPKGLALFLEGYARLAAAGDVEAREAVRILAGRLEACATPTAHGLAWGYNFPWQSRAFFAPAGTPNIIVTSFAGLALLAAADALAEPRWREPVRRACAFLLHDLPKRETDGGIAWSYTPVDESTVYNASALGARLLAVSARALEAPEMIDTAVRAARLVARAQQPDGGWAYGAAPNQAWRDGFHAGYILESLATVAQAAGGPEFNEAIRRGFAWYAGRCFGPAGEAWYYADRRWPLDTHAAAEAVECGLTVSRQVPEGRALAARTAAWAVGALRRRDGAFVFRRYAWGANRIPYMRWTQAWMFRALARLTAGGLKAAPTMATSSVSSTRVAG